MIHVLYLTVYIRTDGQAVLCSSWTDEEGDDEDGGQVVFRWEGCSGPYGSGGHSSHEAAGTGLWSRYCVL